MAYIRGMADPAPIRDAATVILVRDPAGDPRILMGQRGAAAAFMPSKFVFPGGAVDAADHAVPAVAELPLSEADRLQRALSAPCPARALAMAGIRELWEETGLRLGRPAGRPARMPPGWSGFDTGGLLPDPSGLHFFFRAVTPPGRPRRFDARFFLADAGLVHGDLDDFSGAADELSRLQWVPMDAVQGFDLPFITQVVLAELADMLPRIGPPAQVPFYCQDGACGRLVAL